MKKQKERISDILMWPFFVFSILFVVFALMLLSTSINEIIKIEYLMVGCFIIAVIIVVVAATVAAIEDRAIQIEEEKESR